MTSNLILSLLVLSFEDHFRFFMLFLNKSLDINRKKFFDLNTVKKEKAVKSQSKVCQKSVCNIVFGHEFYGYFCSLLTSFFLLNLIYIHLFVLISHYSFY